MGKILNCKLIIVIIDSQVKKVNIAPSSILCTNLSFKIPSFRGYRPDKMIVTIILISKSTFKRIIIA